MAAADVASPQWKQIGALTAANTTTDQIMEALLGLKLDDGAAPPVDEIMHALRLAQTALQRPAQGLRDSQGGLRQELNQARAEARAARAAPAGGYLADGDLPPAESDDEEADGDLPPPAEESDGEEADAEPPPPPPPDVSGLVLS